MANPFQGARIRLASMCGGATSNPHRGFDYKLACDQ
jgi:hypothetical protein